MRMPDIFRRIASAFFILLTLLAPAWCVTSRPIAPSDIQSFITSVIAPAATGVQATDTANLQGAVNATPNGGWLYIPCGAYQINAAISITQPMRVSGCGVHEIFTGNSLPDVPWTAPYLAGTVLIQNTAATDVIDITGTGLSVDLSDFGMMFGSSIWFANTGHGINAQGLVVSGQSYHDTGLAKSKLRNLTVFGHDGNHYGYRFLNGIEITRDSVWAYGGGHTSWEVDNPGVNYGNVVDTDPFGILMTAGTAHCFNLKGADTGTFGALNLMVVIRPQCNSEDLTAHFPTSTKPTSSQYLWKTDTAVAGSGANYVRNVRIIAPDLESDVAGVTNPVIFDPSVFVDASGTMGDAAYITLPDYNTASPPTVAVLSGAGSGASASVNGGPPAPSDLSGTIILITGTGSPNGDLFTVTYGTPLFRTPKFVAVFLTFALTGVSQQFSVHTFDANGFTVQSNGANPAAATGYQISWIVEQ